MGGRKEERERLREERLAAQRAAQSSDKRRLYLGYAVAGVIVAAILAGLVVVITGSGGGDETGVDSEGNAFPEFAFINEEIGFVPDGLEPDGREGTEPPPVENAVLEDAAKAAELRAPARPRRRRQHPPRRRERAGRRLQDRPADLRRPLRQRQETASGALADGAYAEFPPVGRWVHSMEHGRVSSTTPLTSPRRISSRSRASSTSRRRASS